MNLDWEECEVFFEGLTNGGSEKGGESAGKGRGGSGSHRRERGRAVTDYRDLFAKTRM